MKFNNRPNECVELPDGRTVWLSRSVAVTASIVVQQGDDIYVLINQRGPGLPNFVGYWNLPCGYLDYDECTTEAAKREVWEECGLDVTPLLDRAQVSYFDAVWDVTSRPKDQKQNVSIHHGLFTRVNDLPSLSNAYCEANEVTEVRWQPLNDVPKLAYAFNHQSRIVKFLKLLQKELREDCPGTIEHYLKSLDGQ